MIRALTLLALAAVLPLTQGCAGMSGTEKGVAIGAVGGAVAGRALSHGKSGSSKTGATVAGAVVGGLLGGVIGHQSDKADEANERADAAEQRAATAQQQASTTVINVANSNGSVTPVVLRWDGSRWQGPRGEYYNNLPTESQLRPVYAF